METNLKCFMKKNVIYWLIHTDFQLQEISECQCELIWMSMWINQYVIYYLILSKVMPLTIYKWHEWGLSRVLVNSKFGVFYSNFLSLTPNFVVSIEKYSKTPTFSGRQHFCSYSQNPSENSVIYLQCRWRKIPTFYFSPWSTASFSGRNWEK